MPLSRKQFVTTAAAGASAAAFPSSASAQDEQRTPVKFHVLKPSEFNHPLMMQTLSVKKPHKQVFQSANALALVPGVAAMYIHMQNSMNAHEFSLGFGPGSLATLGVLMGPSIILGLADPMWTKYGFSDAFKVAHTNIYYKAGSLRETGSPDDPDSIYQDWSAQAVLHRGGALMVCHNAMTFVASVMAGKSGQSPQAVLADFEAHVLPGFQVVPAGVAAVQLAQQHGFTLFALA